MSIKSDQDIINEIIVLLEKENKNNEKDILISLPIIVIYFEKNYKHLKGDSKKKLVVESIKVISKEMGLDNAEIESYIVVLPYVIDGLVWIGNNSGGIFAKMKKSKFICC